MSSKHRSLAAILIIGSCLIAMNAEAQTDSVIYDESLVPEYVLPNPLVALDGSEIESAQAWIDRRRPEILRLFEEHVYGRMPSRTLEMSCEIVEQGEALNGLAERRQIVLFPTEAPDAARIEILLYIPQNRTGPAPLFLGYNFLGNHTVNADPNIRISAARLRDLGDDADPEAARGSRASRWCVEMILERGYGLATIYYGDVTPDAAGRFEQGIHALFHDNSEPGPDEWGAIGAWAWGLSRVLDCLEQDPDVDAGRVAVMGHSRLGKTSLWAGAADERFALVISNNSGCGGAALSRRQFGETVERINRVFPHWFCRNFRQYGDNEGALPVDQHMLIALAAPRPVYIASAEEDRWADPRGEFLAGKGADPVYRLLTGDGLDIDDMPGIHEPTHGRIGYHIRAGAHDVTNYDWEQFLNFADRYMR